MFVYVVKPDRMRGRSMGMPIEHWMTSRSREEDVWFVKIAPRLHTIVGFEGKYEISIGERLLTFQRDDARFVKTLDLDGLMDWLRRFPVVTVVLHATTWKRPLGGPPQGRPSERVLFDCRAYQACYAHRASLAPLAQLLRSKWVPEVRGRVVRRHWGERVVPELKALPPISDDPLRKHVLPRDGGIDYQTALNRFQYPLGG